MKELIIMQIIDKTLSPVVDSITEFFGGKPEEEKQICRYKFTDNEKQQIRNLRAKLEELTWNEFTAVINTRYSCDKTVSSIRRICK